MQFQIKHVVEILRQTPTTLNSLLQYLSDFWILQNDGAESWSPFDIVGHLIHGEETDWIPRIKIILERGPEQVFTPFDRFAFVEKSKGKQLNELLGIFANLRKENLAILEKLSLTEKQLVLEGTHPEFGRVTLRQLLATWAVHDLSHIRQIARVMAKQYSSEVGPWRKYLPVLEE